MNSMSILKLFLEFTVYIFVLRGDSSMENIYLSDFILLIFANAFFLIPLYSYEIYYQNLTFSKDFYNGCRHTNYYFLLTNLVLACLLTATCFFVPFGKIILLALATSGLSIPFVELYLYIKSIRIKNVEYGQPKKEPAPTSTEQEQEIKPVTPTQRVNQETSVYVKPPRPHENFQDPHRVFYTNSL